MTPTTADPVSNPPPAAPPTTGGPPFPWPPPEMNRNREAVLARERDRWYGRFVAWAWDGTRILAGADTREELHDALLALGADPFHVVYDYIDPPDASYF